jgi:hypothetical protein
MKPLKCCHKFSTKRARQISGLAELAEDSPWQFGREGFLLATPYFVD